MKLKTIVPMATAFVLALMLSACASLLGPRNVDIPLSRLQEAVARKFPFDYRYLELFDMHLANPQVSLQPDSNRILTSMDAAVTPPFLKQKWQGNFAISGQLKFDPARNALVLAQPRMERFALDGVDSPYANRIARAASELAEQLIGEVPLYTFAPDDLRYGGTRFSLSKITTKRDGLVVTFEPAR
ncbi:DUF1439 domain-containing protein [Noviherbaspirillum massiliense]|uniref:DUF1439 domain-containing protein n=1 Tax=Noviherbaspirillum massiliense TaxID=1465823 RepID=UPI0002DBA7FC|nr:DUF1439 domain-containing protein [Noviherbaspirillum massiliense]